MISLILSNLGWIIGAIVAVLGLVFARKAGVDAERVRRSKAEQRARDIALEEEAGVDAMPSDEAREELKKWGRK